MTEAAEWQIESENAVIRCTIETAAVGIFAISALAALWLATAQPGLGLVMLAGDYGLVGLVEVQRTDLPAELRSGGRITHIGTTELRAGDVIEEPDTLSGHELLNAFCARQTEIAATLALPRVVIGWSDQNLAAQ